MTLANKITFIRVVGLPFFIYFLSKENFWNYLIAFILFILLSSTDWIDGLIARKRKEVTVFGQFMDPLADKLLVTSTLIYFVTVDWLKVSWWMVVIIILREFIITGLRTVAAKRHISIPALISGKVKTTVQMIVIVVILAILVLKAGFIKWDIEPGRWDVVFKLPFYLILFAMLTTLYSGVSYVVKYSWLFKEEL